MSYQLGLVGYPIEHSLSPRLHRAALSAASLKGDYHLFPVEPDQKVKAALRRILDRMRYGELHGLNVTIPHKQTVISLIDELTPLAHWTGAVNTIQCNRESLVGHNTDVPGFARDLQSFLAPLESQGFFQGKRRMALVLGAGGAARAVAYALLEIGWSFYIAARSIPQAQKLFKDLEKVPMDGQESQGILAPFRQEFPNVVHLSAGGMKPVTPWISLVINATPLGMAPYHDACSWPDAFPLPPDVAVYDLVYNPPQTRLLAKARACGSPVANGLGMLVEQAALAFERWTGLPASRQAMKESVEEYQLV